MYHYLEAANHSQVLHIKIALEPVFKTVSLYCAHKENLLSFPVVLFGVD